MEELRNLEEIYSHAAARFNQYDGKDFVLPQVFKEQVRDINGCTITYNQYSAIIETKGTQNGILSIFLPNQWFYIASYFTDFYNELMKYKKYALKVTSKERLKDLNGKTLTAQELSQLEQLGLDETSKSYLLKFITDYSWWSGAKTVDRGDFYVSPILTCAKLVNASQSYVADLCAFLADKNDIVKYIISAGDITDRSEPVLIINESKLSSFVLSTIQYFDKKDNLNSIVPFANDRSPIKVYKKNEFKLVGMFLESTIEKVRKRNLVHQPRWFEYAFKLGEREVFLSTQWNSQGNYQLTLPDFIAMIKCCYGKNYSYTIGSNGEHQLYCAEEKLQGREITDNVLQQIFYGAPGTGKSYEINRLTEEKEVIRTTFHPDSDYSTFVGAYKPTSIEVPVRDVTGKVIIENGQKVTENRIIYEFVPQAFLKAYTGAWKNQDKPFFLIIEEINRGNCAQIFGDLFQLLDRNNDTGLSDYPISPDEDIQKFLLTDKKYGFVALTEEQKAAIPEKVLSGDLMILPKNLYIWATMNTSDQSLFPIDSAFKRRWDWKYIPISEGRDETGKGLGYRIEIKGKLYDWWEFVEKINKEIGEQTKSEDKKIGYFFCKARNGIIDADTFVSKVIFYLWNDVFKDQDVASVFGELTFSDFYNAAIKSKVLIKEDVVETFLEGLEIEPISGTDIVDDGEDEEASDEVAKAQKKESLVSVQIPGHPTINTKDTTVIEAFAKSLEFIGIERILPIVNALKYQRLDCPVMSTQKYPGIENNDKGYSYYQVGELFVVKGCKTYTYIRILEDLNTILNVGLSLETK